ncbi:hypothetical protein DICSQDRAFT_175983 [Dichomitus squalens LYAD-421 SS1]|uniref:Uncharacterized protein n=2 Tax=Dichomitus squalens TaxID=114155 RepID=A0A4Q9Q8F0_9APHY|nr:uncharacterized protein DICSQDRAFT_175983 [Dichomitus squalens LYAD-421 SS1]EJF55387.1 hypothetical protein DICSQDRAFT_175983 [Dichomitus squalens LYAD-421 SS1]TBU63326.1 hypothetical protein BD310DRAFT_945317 [Dichomitus squalens]
MSAPSAYEDDGDRFIPLLYLGTLNSLGKEGIMVIPMVLDAPRCHPSRAEADCLSQSCGHYAKIPDGNLRQGK